MLPRILRYKWDSISHANETPSESGLNSLTDILPLKRELTETGNYANQLHSFAKEKSRLRMPCRIKWTGQLCKSTTKENCRPIIPRKIKCSGPGIYCIVETAPLWTRSKLLSLWHELIPLVWHNLLCTNSTSWWSWPGGGENYRPRCCLSEG